jgi:cyclopropane-fatty-acyl-phospholipid synthase
MDRSGRRDTGFGQKLIERIGFKIEAGTLRLTLPSNQVLTFSGKDTGAFADVVVHRWRAFQRMLAGGDVGAAEAYVDGDWSSPDLVSVIRVFARNRAETEQALLGSGLSQALGRFKHWLRANTKRGSRRNILFHYDLGNAFYGKWLDPDLIYSSAIWTPEANSLESAQAIKLAKIVEKLALAGGEKILEIGCGWGALAKKLARDANARIAAISLSPSQLQFAKASATADGLDEAIDFRLQDYRDVEGSFDRIVSIEMIEAVGEAFLPSYFAAIRRHLNPLGRAVIQAITIAEERVATYRRNPDFIQRHIFPGGFVPSKSALREHAHKAGLRLINTELFGGSYAKTLAAWRERFDAHWDEIAPLGFDARFKRLWDYYLAYCEAGFTEGAVDVGLYTLELAD